MDSDKEKELYTIVSQSPRERKNEKQIKQTGQKQISIGTGCFIHILRFPNAQHTVLNVEW